MIMRFILLIGVLFLSGCNTLLGPLSTAIAIGEASQAIKEAEDATTYPITPVKQIEPIPLPPQEPKIDLKKGIESIPTWLIMLAVISGSLYIINILRNYNKKGVSRDRNTNRSSDDGRWGSDGRSIQVHGQCPEEQTKADGNDDEGSSTTARSKNGRSGIHIKVGRRSSTKSRQ